MWAARASLPWLVALLGCAPHTRAPTAATPGTSARATPVKPGAGRAKAARPDARCTYGVSVTRSQPFEVTVTARCESAGTTGFRVTEPAAVPFVRSGTDAAARALIPAKI